jgi:ABC-type uncharacterized transport system auxiliary subunit
MKYKITLPFILLFFMGGCFSEQTAINKYYTIGHHYNSSSDSINEDPKIGGICELMPVEINALYESNKIVNRSDSHEISYYKYHQWAVRPSTLIREMILQHLETSNLFEGVSTRYLSKIPDYRFVAIIRSMEVIEDDESLSAHLDIEFRIQNKSGEMLVNHIATRTEKLQEKDMNLFAGKVSSIIKEELDLFISGCNEENLKPGESTD